MVAFDDHTLIFRAEKPGLRAGLRKPFLWRSDGTDAGTQVINEIESPNGFKMFNGELYFFSRLAVYKTDGTVGGAFPLVTTGVHSLLPSRLHRSRRESCSFHNGFQLWVTDGRPPARRCCAISARSTT